MTKGYSEIPENWTAVESYVNKGELKEEIYRTGKCFFYDACSFRYHANLDEKDSEKIHNYILQNQGIVVVIRSILMELASHSGVLEEKYIQYFKYMAERGIHVYIIYEEELFEIMQICFAANEVINSYLTWAVRKIKRPTSTIETVMKAELSLQEKIIKGKNCSNRELYRDFFTKVRMEKEAGDNLGEEMIGICVYILSRLPEEDGKFCVITDDREAAGRIYAMFESTNPKYRGRRIILYSTPKIAQRLYDEGVVKESRELLPLLLTGTDGHRKVFGSEIYDFKDREISLSCEEIAEKIVDRKIHIIF